MFLSGNAPKNFVSFEFGWFKGIDFNEESEKLLKILNKAKKGK